MPFRGMKEFKKGYFSIKSSHDREAPQQSFLIFDEAQRVWDTEKLNSGFSEPDGFFDVGDRIFEKKQYAVLIGLYGTGQVILYNVEERGLKLWEDAPKSHKDWLVVAAGEIAQDLQGLGARKIIDNNVFLSVSLRADFIDCSKWVEQSIGRRDATPEQAALEHDKLQKTSLRICVTRDMAKIKERKCEIGADHPEWSYGILISNFTEQSVIRKALPGWNIGFKGYNAVNNGGYEQWFTGESKNLDKACSVYGDQGLELDCPIVLFGSGYIRRNGQWGANGVSYDK